MHGMLVKLRASDIVRGVGILSAGTLAAQAISILASVLITRMYSPSEFGHFSTFSATASILAVLLPLSFPLSIPNAASKSEATCLAHLAVLSIMGLAGSSAGLLALFETFFSLPGALSEMYPAILLAPLLGALIAGCQTQRYLLLRHQRYGVISILVTMNSSVSNALKIALGAVSPTFLALVGAVILASVLQVGAGWSYLVRKRISGSLLTLSSLPRYRAVVRRNRSFPLYRMPQDLLATISQNLPVLLLAVFFGPEPAAFYAICRLALEAPSRLVGSAIRDVLYSKISTARRRGGRIYPYVAKPTLAIAMSAVLPVVALLLLGPEIFSTVFGDAWQASGEMAQAACIMFLLNVLNKPSIAAIPTLGLNRMLLFYELFSSGGRAMAFVLGALYLQTPLSSVAAYSTVGAAFYVALIAKVLTDAKRYDNEKAG